MFFQDNFLLDSTSNSTGLTTVSSYAPQSSSFAVVPSSNRNMGQIHSKFNIDFVFIFLALL